ncbi:hypothetical protein Bca101_010087 [Brassica carinata]
MKNNSLLTHQLSHQTNSSRENPNQQLQVYIHRQTTQQSVIDFQVQSIFDEQVRENNNIIAQDLQVTLTIRDYNLDTTARLDVDLIITDLEGTNRPPTTEEENHICTICLEDYSNVTNISILSCGHKFHFLCIDHWLRTNISCPMCRENNL